MMDQTPPPWHHFLWEGDPQLKKPVEQAVNRHQLRPFLFLGPKGVGKRTFCYHMVAKVLASRLSLSQKDDVALRSQLKEKAFPDLFSLEKKGVLVEDLEPLRQFVETHSYYESGFKVVLLPDLHRWSLYCLNKLLKLLEDHWGSVLYLLTSERPLLLTLQSRCHLQWMPPLSAETFLPALGRVLSAPAFQGGVRPAPDPPSHPDFEKFQDQLPLSIEKESIRSFQGCLGRGVEGKLHDPRAHFLSRFLFWFQRSCEGKSVPPCFRTYLLDRFDSWLEMVWYYGKEKALKSILKGEEESMYFLELYRQWQEIFQKLEPFHLSKPSFFDWVSSSLRGPVI